MILRPPRSTRVRSSAASDVYKRQIIDRSFDKRLGRHLLDQGHRKTDTLKERYSLGIDSFPIFRFWDAIADVYPKNAQRESVRSGQISLRTGRNLGGGRCMGHGRRHGYQPHRTASFLEGTK